MISRIVVVAALALAPVVSPLRAQGAPAKHAGISTAVLKSMTSQKPRSKKSMTERAGMKRAATAASVSAASAAKTAATSVRVLDPTKVR
ncbi:MAG TPA: hypothetical protein VD758_12965 [Gemmatimonadaceae bacterium]|nr:hypothetical protein [Gemmatimonadaceae bacterium]